MPPALACRPAFLWGPARLPFYPATEGLTPGPPKRGGGGNPPPDWLRPLRLPLVEYLEHHPEEGGVLIEP